MKLTKTVVDRLSLPRVSSKDGSAKQVIHRDSALPGFALRVGSGGTKTFIVEKRVNGRNKRITLGKYPTLTCEQARKQALETLSQMAQGKDPTIDASTKRAKHITLEEVYNDYLKTHPNLSPDTVHDYDRIVKGYLKDWLKRPMMSIRKEDVLLRHRELGEKSHSRANNAMRVLRALFNHVINLYEDEDGNPIFRVNPVSQLSKTRSWFERKRRETWIKPHELQPWYQATLKLDSETSRDFLHFLLFTGLRKGEALRLRWEDVDFENRTVFIPITKNKRLHALPLSDFLYALLQRRVANKENEWVFASKRHPGEHISDPKTAMNRVIALSNVKFSFHDLRRTFITIAESLDISIYALKRLLNHKDGSDVTAGYIILDVERLREPMERISNKLLEYISSNNQDSVHVLNKKTDT